MTAPRILPGAPALVLAALLAATGAHAQIAFRAAAQAAIAGGTSSTITHVGAGAAATADANSCPNVVSPAMPTGLANDVLVVVVNSREDNATVSVTAGTGWTRAFFRILEGGGRDVQAYIYYKVATGTNSAADPLTLTQTGTCNSITARASRFRGVDTVQPFETSPIPAGNYLEQNANTLATGAQVTTLDGSMLLVAGFINDDRTVAQGAGWSESHDIALNIRRDLGLSLHYLLQATAGSASVSNWALGGNERTIGVIFALRPRVTSALTIAVPAGTAANDVMIASIAARPCSGTSGAACTTTLTPPAGWTLVNSFDQTGGGGTGGFGNVLYVYRRVVTGPEPASYSWTLGGNPVNNGAVGGIASFQGVDTSNAIVVAAGQTTGVAATHAAPSIDTGTVTNTMLVGSFTASSSATWAPPVGMTEAIDVPSLPVPNDLGLSVEIAYEARAAAGATGTRTATQSTPPANDTGATHLLALRPAATLTHYAISVLSSTVANCDFAEVTITAHNAAHTAVNPPATRTLTLSVSAGAATAAWQPTLVSGAGTWTPSGATATYTWPGTQSSFTVRLRQSAVISLTVDANDTFVTEAGGEDPTLGFVDSAFRISNGANAALAIGNQIAAKPSDTGVGMQSLFLQAIRTDTATGSCVSVFPSGAQVDISVGAQCNNPAACTQNVTLTTTAGTGTPSASFAPAGAGTYPATIRFRFTTASGEAPFFFEYADAGQITLQFRHVTAAAPPTPIAGTSNAFVTRPFGFAFRGASDASGVQHGTLPTSALLAAAGDNFTMTLAAYRWAAAEDDGSGNPLPGANITNNGLTPNFTAGASVNASANLPGAQTGTISRGGGCASASSIAPGSWSGGSATITDWCYNEAGNVFLDASTTNYFGIAGFNVIGNSGLDGTGAAGGYVGRFRPKHFVMTGAPTLTNRAVSSCAPASGFTYLDEDLSLGFTLEARNAQNALTENYTGAYAKLDLASAVSLGIGARSGAFNLTPRVDAGAAPAGSFSNGAASLSVLTGIRRATPDSPDGPFVAARFGIAPNDGEGVLMQSYDLDVDGTGGNDHFAVGPTTELRFGRLRVANGYGADTSPLQLLLDVQYWSGSGFTLNAQDHCTTLARASLALAFTGLIAACDTAVLEPSVAFASGAATLALAAPGAGRTGTVTLTPQLGTPAGTYCPAKGAGTAAASASAADYLLGRWDDAANPDADPNTAYDDKPLGRATFGLYGSQPRNFIFFRENY